MPIQASTGMRVLFGLHKPDAEHRIEQGQAGEQKVTGCRQPKDPASVEPVQFNIYPPDCLTLHSLNALRLNQARDLPHIILTQFLAL
jgi:hypothetical protein